jgi:hypothetical protein
VKASGRLHTLFLFRPDILRSFSATRARRVFVRFAWNGSAVDIAILWRNIAMTNTAGIWTGARYTFSPPQPPSPPDANGTKTENDGRFTNGSSGEDKTAPTADASDFQQSVQRWQAMAIKILLGTDGDDKITGWKNSSVEAGDGNDTADVWTGSKVSGGEGNDTVHAWSNSDVSGGAGNDQIDVWSDSRASGGDGNDTIRAWSNSQVDGGTGDDYIDAWSDTRVDGGAGNDDIFAWSSSDVTGGDGDDRITAHSETRVDGGAGNDYITVHSDSRASGGDGNDSILARSDSIVDGGKGDDMISLGPNGVATFSLGDGKDTVRAISGGTLMLGEGFSAEAMTVTYVEGSEGGRTAILSFDGNDTDQITVKVGASPLTVTFTDGTTQEIGANPDASRPDPEWTKLHMTDKVIAAYSRD